MTALAYICLFVGAWTLSCGVLRLVDKLEGWGVKKTCRRHVIASQCSHWRGNLHLGVTDSHVGLRPPRNDREGRK